MKLKFILCALGIFLAIHSARAADDGFRLINTRTKIRCGTDLMSKTFAYKDEAGYWKGIDADLCRAYAAAIVGNSANFEMVHVENAEAPRALSTNKVDVMFGSLVDTPGLEVTGKIYPVAVSYYDRFKFLARKIPEAVSMEAYQGATVCAVNNTQDLYDVENFNNKYSLGFKMLKFATFRQALEALMLKRCDLYAANEITLLGVMASSLGNSDSFEILPEVIAVRPVYAYVRKENVTLQNAGKWIMNALAWAEERDMNSRNVDIFVSTKDISDRNLLGITPYLWQKFSLHPDWVKKIVKELGNYGEIYERNLGDNSNLKLPRELSNPVSKGGQIKSQPFL